MDTRLGGLHCQKNGVGVGGMRQQEGVLFPGGGEGARLRIWEFQVLGSKGPGLSGRDFGTRPHSARGPLTVLGRGCSLSPLWSHLSIHCPAPAPLQAARPQLGGGSRVHTQEPRTPRPLRTQFNYWSRMESAQDLPCFHSLRSFVNADKTH